MLPNSKLVSAFVMAVVTAPHLQESVGILVALVVYTGIFSAIVWWEGRKLSAMPETPERWIAHLLLNS